jgi:type IV pilus assembly protein PilC
MSNQFKYSAKDQSGRTVTGTLSAESQNEVVGELRRKNLTPIDIKKVGRATASSGQDGERKKPGAKKASAKKGEVSLFTRQLATMLSAGIPMLEALEILADQAESPGFRTCVQNVVDDIRRGSDLSKAVARYPRVFSQLYVSMIQAGEVSGQIDIILVRLAEYLEASQKLKAEIKSAMTYPVVSLFLVTGIAGFLMIGIVPQFKPVFESLEIELPALTSGIMAAADFLKEQFLFIFAAIGAMIAALVVFKRSERGAIFFDAFILKLPIFGSLFKKVALSRFARTFSTLVKSGVPILAAMEIVANTSGNRVIAKVIDRARENVKQGETLSDPLSQSALFPKMVTKMIGIGERSGALETLLEKIATFYDEQVSTDVKSLTSLIEPIMISVMGFVVGGIVLAVFLPIFKLQEKLSNR